MGFIEHHKASEAHGQSASPLRVGSSPDYGNVNAGNVLNVGGNYNNTASNCGPFYENFNNSASNTNTNNGARTRMHIHAPISSARMNGGRGLPRPLTKNHGRLESATERGPRTASEQAHDSSVESGERTAHLHAGSS